MARASSLVILAAALLLVGPAAAASHPWWPLPGRGSCPPQGFRALSAQEFSLEQYIAARWYVQKQVPLVYQPQDRLYCVLAEYQPLDPSNLLKGVRVLNYANEGGINGPVVGTSGVNGGPLITATIPDPSQPSKLRVGFALSGSDTLRMRQIGRAGDYWVVAAGMSQDPLDRSGNAFDWAIVTGGAPRVETEGGCATGSRFGLVRRFQVNNIGLWLFTRQPVDPANTALMVAKLAELGLDASQLVDVPQQGCTYACGPGQGVCS